MAGGRPNREVLWLFGWQNSKRMEAGRLDRRLLTELAKVKDDEGLIRTVVRGEKKKEGCVLIYKFLNPSQEQRG